MPTACAASAEELGPSEPGAEARLAPPLRWSWLATSESRLTPPLCDSPPAVSVAPTCPALAAMGASRSKSSARLGGRRARLLPSRRFSGSEPPEAPAPAPASPAAFVAPWPLLAILARLTTSPATGS